MEKSKVYFTDFRTRLGEGLPTKLKRLMKKAGIDQIDMDGKFVAIKMHFGELGNLAFLRPNYAKVVADLCKEQGGLPFLTDCNTLYPGSRPGSRARASRHSGVSWVGTRAGCARVRPASFMSRTPTVTRFRSLTLSRPD